jgi:hypothetical protein
MAAVIAASLLALPALASGETKAKKAPTQAAKDNATSSVKSTSPKPDYKSKYRGKEPPPQGGRPPKPKENRPPDSKIKNPPGGNGGQPPHRRLPKPGEEPIIDPYPFPPPILPPQIIVVHDDIYDGGDYGYYEGGEEDTYNAESASLLFSVASVACNYVFVSQGQTNEFAAGVGLFFGITSLAVATRPHAEHPVLGYLLGGASIAFAVWNLAGGMHGAQPYDGEVDYVEAPGPSNKHVNASSAGQTVGWSFSF